MELKLSKIVDDQEQKWKNESEILISNIIKKLNDKLKINLYELSKLESPIETFNYFRLFLLDKYKSVLYETLLEFGINIDSFEKEIILSFILTITRNKPNKDFLKDLLLRINLITSYKEDNNKIIIDTKRETFEFSKFDELINDNKTKKFISENDDIYSSCHESAEYLLKLNSEYLAVTGICEKNLGQKYYHSFILYRNYVIDLTSNLYIEKDYYYKLYKVTEINKVNYDEFLTQSENSKCYDESGTLFPLLRNAIYIQTQNLEQTEEKKK